MMIEVRDLWKSFDGEPAVRGLNLTVRAGSVHGLLGLNGAGKTTTVKCVVGLLRPDRGHVRVAGRSATEDVSYKSLIGYLPENPSLPEYLTVREFLVFVARLKGLGGRELQTSVSEVAELFGLNGLLDKLIFGLSKGLKQRVAFASAIVNDPLILVLDEPFNGLDPEAQSVAKAEMKEISKRGGSVLVSTHLLDTIERVCDSATIVHRGKDLASGSLEELKRSAGLDSSASLEEAFLRTVSRVRE